MYDDFESKALSGEWWKEYPTKLYSCNIVNNPKPNKSSLRIELRKTDPIVNGGKRAEISLNREEKNEEHWYGLDIFLPFSGTEYYADDPLSAESLTQWHNVPDPGEEWTTSPLGLLTKNGEYIISRLWDENPISKNYDIWENKKESKHNLGSYHMDLGKWVRWVFHVKWGWLPEHNTKLEVFKNNALVLDCSGLPNTTNDKYGVYWKIGIYKWDWMSQNSILTKRIVYYDNISIDDPRDIALS